MMSHQAQGLLSYQAKTHYLSKGTTSPLAPSRQNIVPDSFSPINNVKSCQICEREIRRLEEVIFYVGTSNDKLIVQNEQQLKEIGFLRISWEKAVEEHQVEIRKLKQMLNDKQSECESISSLRKREADLLEKENQRIKEQMKLLIEQKNQELFNIKKDQKQEANHTQSSLICQLETLSLQAKQLETSHSLAMQQIQDSLAFQKDKNSKLENDIELMRAEWEADVEERARTSEAAMGEFVKEFHETKVKILEASQQEVERLEQGWQIQREAYCLQIQSLKRQNERLGREIKEIHEKEAKSENQFQEQMKSYVSLTNQLQNKISSLHQKRQRQLQILKVRTASLQSQSLKAVENTYSSQIDFLSDQINCLQEDIAKLRLLLGEQMEKNNSLLRKLYLEGSRHQEERVKLQMMHEDAEELMRQKFVSEKSVILQKSAQMIKNYEIKTNSIQFFEEELRKLRKQLDESREASEEQEKIISQEREGWELEREQLLENIKTITNNSENAVRDLKKLIDDKSNEIDNLSRQILKSIRDSSIPDNSQYLREIDSLQKEVHLKQSNCKSALEKFQKVQKRCRQLEEEAEKMHLEADLIINEAKVQWDTLSNQKINSIELFYKRKIQFLETEEAELRKTNGELEEKVTQLVLKYKELEFAMSQMISSLQRRGELEDKIVILGTDISLVQSKEKLFHL